jgi:hypothetical protein
LSLSLFLQAAGHYAYKKEENLVIPIMSFLLHHIYFPGNIFQISTLVYTKFNLSNIEIH